MPRMQPSDAPAPLSESLDEGLAQLLSQLNSEDKLRAVAWANKRLAEICGDTYGIAYGGRPAAATLLGPDGSVLASVEDEDAWSAVAYLIAGVVANVLIRPDPDEEAR